ncbi:nodulation-signaling pathway 2 protein-like [Senna tora]|uniref:Nodulation-signaling pathway 2 protein-like n=1 Tax=Senna tora TaxID=362788 RepID=A0A834TNE4_9FABA|nr:nodulation-signaling pathway 2 protein-like [Senna tora]
MEPEILQSSWPLYEATSSIFDQVESYLNLDDTSSELSSIIPFSSTIFSNHHFHHPLDDDDEHTFQLPSLTEDFSMDLDAFDPSLSSQILGFHGYPEESTEGSFPSLSFSSEGEVSWSPTPSMKSDLSNTVLLQPQPSLLTLPQEDMEMETQLSLPHLLEAIGEAMEQGQNTLAQVILKCISQKVNPLGDPLERIAFKLCSDHNLKDQGHFIKQEACKNLNQIFKAFYQGLPHGKFAHFTANSAILNSIPQDSDVIHIIDLDLGEGVQWPPLIEAIAHQHKTLKLTSIKWEEEDEESPESDCVSTQWKFEETRRNLYEHAKSCGLKLKVEEKSIEELVTELKKLNKRGGKGKTNFMAFNCMVGLPHMGRVRSTRKVSEFVRVAKDLIKSSTSTKGIITYGDGQTCEKLRNCMDFRSFFHGNVVHYHALLESIESSFTSRFTEARTAMECLFVDPYVSSLGWFQKWKDMRECLNLEEELGLGLEGQILREGVLMEIGEMIRGSEGLYEAKIERKNGNEMVLQWKGTELAQGHCVGTTDRQEQAAYPPQPAFDLLDDRHVPTPDVLVNEAWPVLASLSLPSGLQNNFITFGQYIELGRSLKNTCKQAATRICAISSNPYSINNIASSISQTKDAK